jgi:hypothetical protein
MKRWPLYLETTVDSLLPDWPPLPPADRAAITRYCTDFVSRQISLAPAHIRCGIWILYAAFVLFAGLLAIGQRTSQPSHAAVALSRFSSLGPAACVALERVLRSMTVLAFLEHPRVAAAIDAAGAAP